MSPFTEAFFGTQEDRENNSVKNILLIEWIHNGYLYHTKYLADSKVTKINEVHLCLNILQVTWEDRQESGNFSLA